jgi:Phytanoyl-CoA dioxygenase (PhyH)
MALSVPLPGEIILDCPRKSLNLLCDEREIGSEFFMPMRNRPLPGRHITDCQMRLFMSFRQTETASVAAAKAGFSAATAYRIAQDYGTWARDDGMPEPRAMNIAVFMDEVMPINGPLMLVPRSHEHGVLSAGRDEETTSYPLWTLDKETVTKLVAEGGSSRRPESRVRC